MLITKPTSLENLAIRKFVFDAFLFARLKIGNVSFTTPAELFQIGLIQNGSFYLSSILRCIMVILNNFASWMHKRELDNLLIVDWFWFGQFDRIYYTKYFKRKRIRTFVPWKIAISHLQSSLLRVYLTLFYSVFRLKMDQELGEASARLVHLRHIWE